MGLFGKKKDFDINNAADDMPNAKIKILGSGCAKCNLLETNTKQALQQLGLYEDLGHVRDFVKIAAYGVMSLPAIVFNDKVISSGKVLNVEEIKELLKQYI